MSHWLLRSLVLACSLLQALPPGWCCCCGSQAGCCRAAQPDGEAAARPTCCHCCRKAQAPSSDLSKEKSQPSRPAKVCCCQRQPVTLQPKTALDLDPVAVAPVTIPADVLPACAGCREAGSVPFVASSPPIHVLQCVWLC